MKDSVWLVLVILAAFGGAGIMRLWGWHQVGVLRQRLRVQSRRFRETMAQERRTQFRLVNGGSR